MPKSVVDGSDSEPDEYRPPPDGRPRAISAERVQAVRDGARAVAAAYYAPLHPDVYTLSPVRTAACPAAYPFRSLTAPTTRVESVGTLRRRPTA